MIINAQNIKPFLGSLAYPVQILAEVGSGVAMTVLRPRLEELIREKRVIAVGSKTRIKRIRLNTMSGDQYENESQASDMPLNTIYVGTKYSYREKLPSGHQCHELKRLDGSRSGVNYAPDHLRPVFLKVLTDCIVAA